MASFKTYMKDPGFWGAVVLVNLGVALVLTVIGAPGFKRS